MKSKMKIKAQDTFSENCAAMISGVISLFLLVLMTVFPLILHNAYFDILETKYKCFYMSVLTMLAVLLVMSVTMFVIDRKEFQGEHAKKMFSSLKVQNWRKTFSLGDGAVIVFWLISVISTLQSEYLYEAFWGNEGRYSGLFLMSLYVIMYFIVSRFWKPKGWILQVFLLSGLLVCAFGITDYFQMDIFQLRKHIKPEQAIIFTSTMGNINTYTAYIAMMMGVSAAMFATAKKTIPMMWYYICMVVSFTAIIMGCSDNAYLALGVLFAGIPFAIFYSKQGVFRYFVIVATFMTVIQVIAGLNVLYADQVIGLESLFQVLTNFPGAKILTLVLWGVTFLYGMIECRKDKNQASKNAMKIWAAVVLIGFLILCFMLFDTNVMKHSERYGALQSYLVFGDRWGSNRGYIWRKTLELYRNFPMMHKIFGYGPDTFGIMTTNRFFNEMLRVSGEIFDTAHNEYLQFLITVGPIAVVSYVLFLVASLKKMAVFSKNIKENGFTGNGKYAIGCLFAVACYCVQAIVNLNLPIATPMMWTLLSIGIAIVRCTEDEK